MKKLMASAATEADDECFMLFAIEQAELAVANGEVPVGCVYVLDGVVIGSGYNATNAEHDATRHAELVAADQVLHERGDVFASCDLYSTCEPCLMCAAAIGRLGIRRVVFGCHNDRFGGCGSILHLHDGKYDVKTGVRKEDAVSLFRRFYARENDRAPETKRKRKPTASNEVDSSGEAPRADCDTER